MAGPHGVWPYATGDPNKPKEVIDAEAVRAYELQLRGHDLEYISKALGLTPRTIQRRISDLILARERPIREVMRWMLTDRIQGWTLIINERLDDDTSNADAARLIAEGAKLVGHLRAMHDLNEPVVVASDESDEVEDDDWEARADG